MNSLNVIILAAGLGKRMLSDQPKVLHLLAGKPLLKHILATVKSLNPQKIYVVYGHQGDMLREAFQNEPILWVEQSEQLGSGHAVLEVLPFLEDNEPTLILYADMPLISQKTLERLLEKANNRNISWLTAFMENPTGFGRIVRDWDHKPLAIVEEKDATETQKQIKETNTGVCVIPSNLLKRWLPHIKNDNSQGEYYLTDLLEMAAKDLVPVMTAQPETTIETFGVNNKAQLAFLERELQRQLAQQYMQEGLILLDPTRFDVRGDLTFGKDVVMDINVIIEGKVTIGNNCTIGANVVLRNVTIADYVVIKPNCVIEDAILESHCVIGPFAHIRPETVIKEHAKVGNFVEIKKSEIGACSKANHLSYVGDAIVGKNVNIGAGTITCNYDGVKKHQTIIEDNAFIGSCSQLIAPIKIGEGATIGAGSTITMDTPKQKLTLSRARQVTIENWERPKKKIQD
ncbi:MAG: bifunctional UDP-N-acetylglucosamine diphosphorylase/glucosamine-1-phosphate N-acetyltransferase GlmU [Gammaproteobacteria bacterium]|nr:bifunctional UDP-N-acetylglucosamine diphosphorylase/glucosamine-1-phosphate N-acetyltransferase GlmU [Gammaproteobacteria bacterium]